MQGISVYDRPGRSCWYVSYVSAKLGRQVDESSGIKTTEPKAKAYAYARARNESGTAVTANEIERFDNWAEKWLMMRYRSEHQVKTLTSYLGAWKHLGQFLRDSKLFVPRLLEYQHVIDFVVWRENQIKKQSGKKVSRNTALHNVRVLSRLMREAVKRGYCQGNPCLKLGDDIPRDIPQRKAAFTDQQITMIRDELERRREVGRPSDWMQIAFEIGIHQGCRLAATQIPMDQIDFDKWTITFREKGSHGKPQEFTNPVHPGLKPLLMRLRAEGREVTTTLPRFASRNFTRVLKTIPGLDKQHSFRSTRISVISRMAKNGVNEQKAKRYVHHASSSIHAIYQRLEAADVSGVPEALALPSPASGPKPLPQQTADDRRAISRLLRESNKTP